MNTINKPIVIATAVIVAGGVIKKWSTPGATLTPILLGGFVFMLALSVADLIGGGMAKLASALAVLAMTTVILTEFPWSQLIGAVRGKGSGQAGQGGQKQ